jgi:hypothetical protein
MIGPRRETQEVALGAWPSSCGAIREATHNGVLVRDSHLRTGGSIMSGP